MSPSMRRLLVLTIVAAVVGPAVALFGPWQLAVLSAWIAACSAYLMIVWVLALLGDAVRARNRVPAESS